MTLIKERFISIQNRIQQAVERSGRKRDEITVVAVTKNMPAGPINEALGLGIKHFGENRVQEAQDKRPEIEIQSNSGLVHHFLGLLQTNKARKALELFDIIQSVDRPKLAGTIDRIAGEMGKKQRVFVEVKISPEESKGGMPVQEASDFIRHFSSYRHLQLEGLMTIAPFDVSEDETQICFRSFGRFFEDHKKFLGPQPVLSMGMTDDFEVAIEEGSTMIRIGRALFGERPIQRKIS